MRKETMEMLEEQIKKSLESVEEQPLGSKERKDAVAETCSLIDHITEAEKVQMEYWDKEERREIERERNEQMLKIEQEKNSISTPRMLLEIGKIVIPTVIPIIAYGFFQKRMLDFEENGRITSSAGKELHLPKFMK